jgi:predicted nucleic acid-binding protein
LRALSLPSLGDSLVLVPGLYVDTSALGRVLLAEPDAQVIIETTARYDELWSSALLIVELGRLDRREGLEEDAHKLLSTVSTHRPDSSALKRSAKLDPVNVRTLDAIHLDAALQLKSRGTIDAVLTYDEQLRAGCEHHGLAVEAPVALR